MKIDLTALERIARAADSDNPGVCFQADHVDGYPTADSAMAHFNAFDPATAMSLIRRIRELEALAGRAIDKWAELDREFDLQLGGGPDGEIADARAVLEAGTTQYGRHPVGYDDHWDIDQPADDLLEHAVSAMIDVPIRVSVGVTPSDCNQIDLDELERTARAATQGNWVTYAYDHDDRASVEVHVMIDTGEIVEIAIEASEPDAEHIAAASPPVVLALIARIRDLEKIATRALGEWRAWHAEVNTSNAEAWKATEAEIEAMIRQVRGGAVRQHDASPEPPAPNPHTIGS